MTATDPAGNPDQLTEPPIVPQIDPNVHANLVLENALLRAGVDLETDQGKLVRQAWEGKTPDDAAIKGQWELVRPNAAPAEPEPPVEPRIDGEDGQGQERRNLSAASVVEPNPMDQDPREQAVREGLRVLYPDNPAEHAGTRQDAAATAVHVLMEAAQRGDQRVVQPAHAVEF